jgi:Arylsulfotransferase (ASST)
MRNMWAIYNIDKKTGNIIWQLGGKQSNFTFGRNAAFSWQHDARYRSDNRISLFDDACCASSSSPPNGPARGLILCLNFKNRTAKIDRTYYHDPTLFVASQGNVQELPNGNQFIGWGQEPYVSEYKNAGNTIKNPSENFIYDMQFPNQNLSYRAFKNDWTGLPLYPPSIAANSKRGIVEVFASWNGSTETTAWQVLAGPTPKALSVIIETPRTGFETTIKIKSACPYFQVKALSTTGSVLGVSKIIYLDSN